MNADKPSAARGLDPRVKLFIIVFLTTLAVLCLDVMYLGIVVIVAITADLCFRIDVINLVLRLKHFLWLLLFIAVVQSLCVKGGTTLIAIGSVNLLTARGLQFALEFILRMAVILFAGAIAASAEGREMLDGLQVLKVPYLLIFMSGIALKYLPVFREEFSSRLNAIAMRGIEIKKLSPRKKLKLYVYLISPTVSGAVLKSGELARSMETRGFRAYKKRTMLRRLEMRPADWCALISVTLLFAAFLAVMYTFGVFVIF